MTEDYQYRQYRDGDAVEINRLYADMTGTTRSLRDFDWQWLQAPGGHGDIWLIEATINDGTKTLVGHHGIMPVRFSRGEENLLFGKTENTMLRQEYRSKVLYPRFERRFAEVYESRFDALFSTVGPPAAIRQRRAMGYVYSSRWVHLKIPTSWIGEFAYVYRAIFPRLVGRRPKEKTLANESDNHILGKPGGSPLLLRALDDTQARFDPFFDTFWPQCRSEYGLTPRRDKEDLIWRFWSNPYTSNITLVSDDRPGEPGYVIVRISGSSAETVFIEDIVPCAPTSENFYRLLDSALSWMSNRNIRWVNFSTTDESCASGAIASGIVRRNLLCRTTLAKFRSTSDEYMPRKVTSSGICKGVDLDNWYVTPMLFEGRTP